MSHKRLLDKLINAALEVRDKGLQDDVDSVEMKKYTRLRKLVLARMSYEALPGDATVEDIAKHRFCTKNVRKNVNILAAEAGMTKKDYIAAVEAGLIQEMLKGDEND